MKPVRDKNYVKVFVLYLLKNLDRPLDYNTINDIALYDGYVEYIDFATCFSELLDDGLVREIKGGEGELDRYEISERGLRVAESLSDGIFEEIREQSLKTAMRVVSFKENDVELFCEREEISEGDGGGYYVTCRIEEKKRTVCSVTLRVENLTLADEIKRNFRERPDVIRRGVRALLSGDVNKMF